MTAIRTPDPVEYERALHKLGWWLDRQTKRGALYRSPDGHHCFVLSSHIHTKDFRAVKNDIARLRREGGQALELANTLTGQRRSELHLPAIDPTRPPIEHVDEGERPVLAVVEEPAAVVEEPEESSYLAKYSEDGRERMARSVVVTLLRYFGGEVRAEDSDARRSAAAILHPHFRTSEKTSVALRFAEDAGYVDCDWRGEGKGSRAGRSRITVTARGREVVGEVKPAVPQRGDNELRRELAELRELLEIAERERDEAKAAEEAAKADKARLQASVDDLFNEREAANLRVAELEAQLADADRRIAELHRPVLTQAAEPKPWNMPHLQAVETILRQIDANEIPSIRDALATAACTMLEKLP